MFLFFLLCGVYPVFVLSAFKSEHLYARKEVAVPVAQCTFSRNDNCILNHEWRNKTPLPLNGSQKNATSQSQNVYNLWRRFPLKLMENSKSIGPKCQSAYNHFLEKLEHNHIDAIKMFDATAKVSSGLLRGNVNQFGDFDECLSVSNGQYCLAEIDLEPIWSEPFSKYKELIYSHYAIRETLNDPGHRVPGFTNIRWGFCIPSACDHEDLENVLNEKLNLRSRVRPKMCQVAINDRPSEELGWDANFAQCFFIFVITCIVAASVLNSKIENGKFKKNIFIELLSAFAIQKNFSELSTIKNESAEIRALHGVRFLNAFGLLLSHKVMALFYSPYINRSVMTENLGMAWSVIGRTAILYTECFMILSGLLNANALFASLEKNNCMKIKDKIIARLFRILPTLLAVILFCTYYLPYFGSGPLWPLVVDHHSELCKKYMWRNLFMIHNYFGFENMCLTHTHQIGIDMQLFLATPILVYCIWKNAKIGFWLMGIVSGISTILRIWATWHYNLSHVVHFGIPISRMFDTANLSYILPTHRASVYLIGVALAYLLRYYKPKPFFSTWQLAKVWLILLGTGFSVWFGPIQMSRTGYEYNKMEATIYAAVAPFFWGIPVAWTIYTTNRDHGGWLGNILEWRQFQKFTKISYSVYLVQFPIFFYNVGLTRHVGQFSASLLFPFSEYGLIILVSVVLTLCIEMPFQNIRKILFHYKYSQGIGGDREPVTKAIQKHFFESTRGFAKLG